MKPRRVFTKTSHACSPLSVTTMLSMLTAETDEHGLKDFLSSLGCKSMDELNSKSLELTNVASSKGSWKPGDPLLSVANGCWLDQRYSLKPFFKETLQSIFKVESKAMDFENKVIYTSFSLQENWAIAAGAKTAAIYEIYCGAFLARRYIWDLLRRSICPSQ